LQQVELETVASWFERLLSSFRGLRNRNYDVQLHIGESRGHHLWIPGSRRVARPQMRNCASGNDDGTKRQKTHH
jgi:hypothetical protein